MASESDSGFGLQERVLEEPAIVLSDLLGDKEIDQIVLRGGYRAAYIAARRRVYLVVASFVRAVSFTLGLPRQPMRGFTFRAAASGPAYRVLRCANLPFLAMIIASSIDHCIVA